MNKTPIIVALDFAEESAAWDLVNQLNPQSCGLKVGKEMFTRFGPQFVKALVAKGFDIFLDLKFHDIPNQVAGAVKAAADLGIWMVNVHALGGRSMLEAAGAAIDEINEKTGHKPLLIGVTILTSHNQADIDELGIQGNISQQVLNLAKLCQEAGLDGVVCSAQEAPMLRENLGKEFVLVTPGIRLESSPADDQQRIVTPEQAIINGADYLVIGRPITQSATPMQMVDEIIKRLQ